MIYSWTRVKIVDEKEALKAGDIRREELIPEFGSMGIMKSQNCQHLSGGENENIFT